MTDVVDAIPGPSGRGKDRIPIRRITRFGFKRQTRLWVHAAKAEHIIEEGVCRRGKEALEKILVILMDMAMEFQPWPAERGEKNPHEDRALFDRYIVLAMKCAAEVAPYQSPKAILIKTANGQQSGEYDLDQLSDEQLLTLRQLMLAAKPVTIDGAATKEG